MKCNRCEADYMPIIVAQFGDIIIEACANCENLY